MSRTWKLVLAVIVVIVALGYILPLTAHAARMKERCTPIDSKVTWTDVLHRRLADFELRYDLCWIPDSRSDPLLHPSGYLTRIANAQVVDAGTQYPYRMTGVVAEPTLIGSGTRHGQVRAQVKVEYCPILGHACTYELHPWIEDEVVPGGAFPVQETLIGKGG